MILDGSERPSSLEPKLFGICAGRFAGSRPLRPGGGERRTRGPPRLARLHSPRHLAEVVLGHDPIAPVVSSGRGGRSRDGLLPARVSVSAARAMTRMRPRT
jgi:hypothetical protein